MNEPVYDYLPLTTPISTAELITELKTRFVSSIGTKIALAICILIFIPLCILSIIFARDGSYVFGAFLLLFATVAAYVALMSIRHTMKMKRFAQKNGLTYLSGSPGERHGMIFDEGHSRRITSGYASAATHYFELANYQYTTGSGKNSQTHTFGFVRLKLPRRLPNMVLDARKNNLFGRISNLPDSFNAGQKLSLEGNFDQYFTLYAPKEYEQDALYVFTPDVMQLVIDEASSYDMEVIDDELYLYTSGALPLTNPTELQKLFLLITKIQSEIGHQTDYYADEKIGDRTANIIAEPGRRLKHGLPVASIVIIVIVVLFQFGPMLISAALTLFK